MFNKILMTSLVLALAVTGSASAALIDGSGITVTVNSINSTGNFPPQSVVDGTGLNGSGEHASGGLSEWYTNNGNNPAESWIAFDLGANYVLDSMHVWNTTQYVDFGIATLDIYVSTLVSPGDPEGAAGPGGAGDWTQIGNNVSFAAAGSPNIGFDLETQTGISLPTTAVRHVRFEVDTAINSNNYVGLAEVQFTAIPEPGSLAFGLGLGGLLIARRRRQA